MAPGAATSFAAAVVAAFGGYGVWQQQGIRGPDADHATASTDSALFVLEGQSEMRGGDSQATVGEIFVAQGTPEEESGIELKLDLDVRELGKVDPTEPDLVEQPAPAVASAPVLATPNASEMLERITALSEEASLPAVSSEPLPESPLVNLGVALVFGFAGLFYWRLEHYQRRHVEDAPSAVQRCSGCRGQVSENEGQHVVQILGEGAAARSFGSDQSACDETSRMPEGPELLNEGEVDAVNDVALRVLSEETEDETLPESEALAADVLNNGAGESVAALSLRFSEASPAAGDHGAAQLVQVLGDFRSLAPAAWAVVHNEFTMATAETANKQAPPAADSAVLSRVLFDTDFRSLSSAVWLEIHKPFHASVGGSGVEVSVASSQAGGNICPSTLAAWSAIQDAAPVATAGIAITSPSRVPAVPDDAFGAESVSSDGTFDGEVLERLSQVLDEEAGAAHSVRADHATAAEWHGESYQHVTPPSTLRVASPAPRMEAAKTEDDKGGLERTLRGISSPNRRRSASSAECTRLTEF